jgi:hypothetical protein
MKSAGAPKEKAPFGGERGKWKKSKAANPPKSVLRRQKKKLDKLKKEEERNVDPDIGALLIVPISSTRRAKVFAFSGKAIGIGADAAPGVGGALLDIREMYEKKDLPYVLPGKKGIALTLAQVEALFAARKEILAAMREATSAAAAEAEANDAAIVAAGTALEAFVVDHEPLSQSSKKKKTKTKAEAGAEEEGGEKVAEPKPSKKAKV